jgi:hypothetical protein
MLTYGVIIVLPQLDVRAHRMEIMFHRAQDLPGTDTVQLAQFPSTELQTWEILKRVKAVEEFLKGAPKSSLQELKSNETRVAEE